MTTPTQMIVTNNATIALVVQGITIAANGGTQTFSSASGPSIPLTLTDLNLRTAWMAGTALISINGTEINAGSAESEDYIDQIVEQTITVI